MYVVFNLLLVAGCRCRRNANKAYNNNIEDHHLMLVEPMSGTRKAEHTKYADEYELHVSRNETVPSIASK